MIENIQYGKWKRRALLWIIFCNIALDLIMYEDE